MKKLLLLALFALPTMASAENDTALTKRIADLEKALRLQTLTTQAIRMEDYDLACKAQREATRATHDADVRDVNGQVDMQFAQICTFSRAISEPNTPSWLLPLSTNAGFEPAGVFFERLQK